MMRGFGSQERRFRRKRTLTSLLGGVNGVSHSGQQGSVDQVTYHKKNVFKQIFKSGEPN
jgi:hypothetical protein